MVAVVLDVVAFVVEDIVGTVAGGYLVDFSVLSVCVSESVGTSVSEEVSVSVVWDAVSVKDVSEGKVFNVSEVSAVVFPMVLKFRIPE